MTAQSAISRFYRDRALGIVIKMLLVGTAVASIVAPVVGLQIDGRMLLLAVAGIWVLLSTRSVRGSRLAASSPPLIAAGEYDAAEENINGALTSFSLSRKVKQLGLHHLAVLRHAQHRWSDSAMLCNALLADRRATGAGPLMRSARLMLAESLLEMNDLPGAYDALRRLHEPARRNDRQRLSLGETMHLMLVQLDYESRIGAWAGMMGGLTRKVELAELMPVEGAARTQSLLALAAKRLGRTDWADWLSRRAALLIDPGKIVADRPLLAELWT